DRDRGKRASHRRDASRSDHLLFGFHWGGESRPTSDVVGAVLRGLASGVDGGRGRADEQPVACNATRRTYREVIRSEMDAVRAAEQRDVDVVVDDEQLVAQQAANVSRQLQQQTSRQRLVPKLHDV